MNAPAAVHIASNTVSLTAGKLTSGKSANPAGPADLSDLSAANRTFLSSLLAVQARENPTGGFETAVGKEAQGSQTQRPMVETSEATGSSSFESAQGNRGASTATLNASGDAPLVASQLKAGNTAKDGAARTSEDKKPKGASSLSEKPASATSVDSPLFPPGVPMKESEPFPLAASMPGSSSAVSNAVVQQRQPAWQRNLSPIDAAGTESFAEISLNSALGGDQKQHAIAPMAANTDGASAPSKVNSEPAPDTPAGRASSEASTPSPSAPQESKPAASAMAAGPVVPTQDAAANATASSGHGAANAPAAQAVIHDAATPGLVAPGSIAPGSITPGSITPGSTTPGFPAPGITTPGLQMDGLTRGASVHPVSGNTNPHAILDGVGPASGAAREAVWQLSPTRVEAGFASAQNSWISVVAERQQGHLTATLELGSAAEHGGLESILPQLSTHLAERQLPVDQLGVSVRQQFFSGNGAGGGADGGAGDPNHGQQRGHSSPPEREPPLLTAMAAGAAGSPVNEGGSRFSVRV
jgi:hypothetical protein